MNVIIKNHKDFYTALLYIALGLAFAAAAALHYPLGTTARMGPGYFPLLLGLLLAGIGAVMLLRCLVQARRADTPVVRMGPWAWRPLLCVLWGAAAFGISLEGLPALGLPPLGLMVGVVLLTLIASLARPGMRWRETLLLAAALALGSYIVFVRLLGQPFALWPAL